MILVDSSVWIDFLSSPQPLQRRTGPLFILWTATLYEWLKWSAFDSTNLSKAWLSISIWAPFASRPTLFQLDRMFALGQHHAHARTLA